MDCSPPGSSVHGILQARILEWVVIPFSRGSSWPRDWTLVSCIAGRVFTIWAAREAQHMLKCRIIKKKEYLCIYKLCCTPETNITLEISYIVCVLVAQSCLTLCDPMDCSPSGSSVPGMLQARILEWVVIPFSRGSSWPRDWTWVSCIAGRFLNHLNHQGSPLGLLEQGNKFMASFC